MNNCTEITECLCCGNKSISTLLDLGNQPLANSYHKMESLEEYPLKLNLCDTCYHLQLSHSVNPDLMFKNYLYVSGTSNTLKGYFEWFVDFTLTYVPEAKNVLDIACNDGTQLDFYKKKGLKTYGVDPAENLSSITKLNGHELIVDYFNRNSVDQLSTYDIVVAQNVFAHNNYPLEFLNLCKEVLSEDGKLFIQTSQAEMLENNEFDTIYHEHISFFNPISMKTIVERSGLFLNGVIKTDIHGTSYVFIISHKDMEYPSLNESIEYFKLKGFDKMESYDQYVINVHKVVFDLKKSIEKFREKGYRIIGYGAAAKGNTLLNFGRIELDYILDDNPLKWDLYTPGMNIPIKDPKFLTTLEGDQPILFVPLAWNFYREIRENIKKLSGSNSNSFVRYFPKLKIEN